MNWEFNEDDHRCKYLHGCPKKLTVDQKFRRILRLLRVDFPTDLPMKVRRLPSNILKRAGHKDAPFGWCSMVNSNKPKAERYFLIQINKSVPWSQQFETILHEWAHALTWHEVEVGRDHGDIFARTFGKLYRAYIED